MHGQGVHHRCGPRASGFENGALNYVVGAPMSWSWINGSENLLRVRETRAVEEVRGERVGECVGLGVGICGEFSCCTRPYGGDGTGIHYGPVHLVRFC